VKIARFSRVGFILAAAGSAVGLGNIWKFPYIAGEYGGGAFVLVYLITVMLIGFSVMIAELLIGYLGRSDAASSFVKISSTHKSFWLAGAIMAMAGLLIMTFYSVVIGWILNYIFVALTSLPASVDEAKSVFTQMIDSSILTQIFFHTVAFVLISAVVARGIKGGIERLNMVLMPLLFVIVGGMFLYALSLDGFSKAVDFMFMPDWSKLNSEAFVTAVGHAFFTLSLGMGALLTYAASLPKNSNLVSNTLIVVALDTGIALVAGLMLFTFLYEYGAEPSSGPGLVFISLPAVFYEMGTIGTVFAVLFFFALAFAGLTSAVSLVEPMVQIGIDKFKMSRLKSSISMGLFFYLIGIVVILSGSSEFKETLTWGGKNLFDWIDFITASIMLPLGGLMMAIFVGFVMRRSQVEAVLKPQLGRFFEIWYFSLRFIAPAALFVVALHLLGVA